MVVNHFCVVKNQKRSDNHHHLHKNRAKNTSNMKIYQQNNYFIYELHFILRNSCNKWIWIMIIKCFLNIVRMIVIQIYKGANTPMYTHWPFLIWSISWHNFPDSVGKKAAFLTAQCTITINVLAIGNTMTSSCSLKWPIFSSFCKLVKSILIVNDISKSILIRL